MRSFLTVSLLALTASVASAQDASVLQTYDLGSLVPAFEERGWTQRLFVSPVESSDVMGEFRPVDGDSSSAEVVVELLTQVLGEELREEGRMIALDGADRLMVLAPVSLQRRIRGLLDELREVLQAKIEVQVDVLTFPGGEALDLPPTNVLDESAADNLLSSLDARGARRETHRVHLSPGRTGFVNVERRIPFVLDYNVEIAQASQTFDPEVVEAQEGLLIVMRGVQVQGGVLLSAVLRTAEIPNGLTESAIELSGYVSGQNEGGAQIMYGPEKTQSVRTDLHAVAFDTFMPEGKTLVVASHADLETGGLSRVVLLRKRTGGAPSLTTIGTGDNQRRIVLANSETLRPPSLQVVSDPLGQVYDLEHPRMGARLTAGPSLFFFDWVKKRFAVWRRIGPWALVVSDPSWDAGTRELEELLSGLQPNTELLSLSFSVAAGGARPPMGFSLPLLAGSQCAVMVGITSTALVDYDVEVAQYSAVADPVFRALFEGLALRIATSRGKGSSVVLDLDGTAMFFDGGGRFAMGGNLFDYLDQPQRSGFQLSDSIHFTDDKGRPARARLGEGSALSIEVELR